MPCNFDEDNDPLTNSGSEASSDGSSFIQNDDDSEQADDDNDASSIAEDIASAEDDNNSLQDQELAENVRIASALTVENLQRHAEENSAVGLEELIGKNNHPQGSNEEVAEKCESDIAREVVTRGTNQLTGEEFVAVSVNCQTDHSYLRQSFDGQDEDLGPSTGRASVKAPEFAVESPPSPVAEATLHAEEDEDRTRREPRGDHKHVTTDLSTSDIVGDSADDAGDDVIGFHVPANRSQIFQSSSPYPDSQNSGSEGEDDDNPVTEIDISGSEYEEGSTLTGSISSVGPPFILRYKRESELATAAASNYTDDIESLIPTDLTWEDLTAPEQQHYTQVFLELKQKRLAENQDADGMINIEPHAAFGSVKEQKAVKESRQEKTRKQEADKKQQQQAQQLANQTNFYSFARQLKTVNYALSSDKCMEEGWTIRPLSPVPTPEPAKELFQQISNSNIVSAHRYHKNFVEKRYDNGEMFLVVFENGTGNVWYHSGNLAISIVSSERSGRVVFIVYEDASRDENPRMQAMFKPDGYCTCYYRNGKIRVNLTPFGGEYYSKEGERLKKWEWRDRETHVHAPPFQPITFALSKQIGVRIIAQEGVYLTFIDGKRSARFNVGTKLRLLQHGSRLEPIDTHRRELQATRLYIHSLMEHMDNLAKFPKSPRMVARMKPHRYLRSRSLVDKTFLNLPSTERAADLQRQSLPQLVRVPHRLSENAKIKKGRTFKATSSSVAAAGGFRLLGRESAARKSKADDKTVAVVVN